MSPCEATFDVAEQGDSLSKVRQIAFAKRSNYEYNINVKNKLVPKKLQAVLWSANTKNLDVNKDKVYIVHQILAYGNKDELIWLFKTYSKKEIVKVFCSYPYKDYTPSRFHFIKNFLLSLNDKLDERFYVKNTPRNLG